MPWLIGALARANPNLTRKHLRLASYTALIRSCLKYCSAVVHSASKTQLQKLDVVQKIAASIILDLPNDAHAAPLLETLRLKSLDDRRRDHIMTIVRNI